MYLHNASLIQLLIKYENGMIPTVCYILANFCSILYEAPPYVNANTLYPPVPHQCIVLYQTQVPMNCKSYLISILLG